MALAQIIHGTGEELISYLKNHRHHKNLTLIIPEEEIPNEERTSYPEGAVISNGVPLFPTEGRTQVVTMEHVKQLLDEEN
jgi:hypothetical protein